jgi:hypothetical protein
MQATEAPRYDAHQVRLIATLSCADPRSVRRVLRGDPIRSSVAQRIETAIRGLRRRGKLPPKAVSDEFLNQ